MKKFNIRVYGILKNESDAVLISKEKHQRLNITKFPGGGLEWGEGTKEALIREFKEEMDLDIEVLELFYLTDFFQESAFNPEDQLISVYYLVKAKKLHEILPKATESHEVQSWVSIDDLHEEDLTFPIDKHVAQLLRQKK